MLTTLYLEQLMQSTVNYFKNEGLEDNEMSHISKIYGQRSSVECRLKSLSVFLEQ